MDLSILWTVAMAAGIPSAIVGLLVWHLKRRIEKREAEQERREEERVRVERMRDDARKENEIKLIDMVVASLVLGEATARAVQRIPDAHCNGDMHDALDAAKKVLETYRKFEREQTVESFN